jgi:hypothetical protein
MTDLPPKDPTEPDAPVEFTKEPQPELPLDQRRLKAGVTRGRIMLWIIGAAFAAYLIITGIVGLLTKAHP